VAAPKFSVCQQAKGAVCTVGDLLTGQSEELVAGASVGSTATSGEKITLTATAKASKAKSFDAKATIDVVTSKSSPTSSPTSEVGDSLPGTSLSTLPDGYTTPSDSNPSGLFPTVSPRGSKARKARDADAVTVSSTLPLDTRLMGDQLLGLVVLAGAVAVAVVRLSLRTGRPDGGGQAG
jgi:hypothetical protein